MNKNWMQDLYRRLFKSDQPSLIYVGINSILFLLVFFVGIILSASGEVFSRGGLTHEYLAVPNDSSKLLDRLYTPFTYSFFHFDLLHVLFNMLILYGIGQVFSLLLKSRQFHFVYLGGILITALFFIAGGLIFPDLASRSTVLMGSTAGVFAILTATATLTPNYMVRLIIFGNVALKYLVLAYILLAVIGGRGGFVLANFAPLAGAVFGYCYIMALKNGSDWSSIFKKEPKLKVVRNQAARTRSADVNQQEVDAILDKISKSGYDKLSKEEKETLFRASKK